MSKCAICGDDNCKVIGHYKLPINEISWDQYQYIPIMQKMSKEIAEFKAENAHLQSGIQREREEIIDVLENMIDSDQRMTGYTAETIREAIAKIKERNK